MCCRTSRPSKHESVVSSNQQVLVTSVSPPPALQGPGQRSEPAQRTRMFTGSTKNPPAKTPQPDRLDEVYAALRRGLQSYLQVHQLELDSLGQQIRENKRNGRLGSLYEQDKQVKAIERFMRRLEFHLSKVEELYDAYCIQRRVRDGASKMVAAFHSASGSREARESLSEANKGYRECTEHMCSLESDLESQMGEFHIKMKGLAGFARLCAGDQYEVLMRYGRQRWRMRGRVEVSSRQVWDSEDYIFLPLVTELLSIKVTELKSLANHVVVGSVSCEMLDLFCPLPQTLAVDINDLGTVKLNLEVTWSPFDKDDQVSSASTVTKRLLSNQSPPDTPSMREQVFYSLLRRQGDPENGTLWSNSSESSDDSSSPALGGHAHRLAGASPALQATPPRQLSFAPRQPSTSTPSLSSNQGEDEPEEAGPEAGFTQMLGARSFSVPNGHLQSSKSDPHLGGVAPHEPPQPRSTSFPSVFSPSAALLGGRADVLAECHSSEESVCSQGGGPGGARTHRPRAPEKTEPGGRGARWAGALRRRRSRRVLRNTRRRRRLRRRKGDDHQEGEGAELDILMEAPEGFRNSDEDCCYLSQGSSAEDLQEACDVETGALTQEEGKELRGDSDQCEEGHGVHQTAALWKNS
ncbi:rho family-interacting cell polarization regulator 1-like [Gadus chalcogrammus]|uniref:rho family-interacting cell polarization regulator 1-like n=1 Tax=Gadus chalcogrammus TaxID=1042646 RepID=UPI0024C4CADA|nr:rho family-interacting cell polarization regulator 1-like [Gadus chalcogrammus]